MGSAIVRTVLVCAALATGGCSRDPPPATQAVTQQPRLSFEAARERCAVTVVETDEVKRCMRAQGWVYRLPWQ